MPPFQVGAHFFFQKPQCLMPSPPMCTRVLSSCPAPAIPACVVWGVCTYSLSFPLCQHLPRLLFSGVSSSAAGDWLTSYCSKPFWVSLVPAWHPWWRLLVRIDLAFKALLWHSCYFREVFTELTPLRPVWLTVTLPPPGTCTALWSLLLDHEVLEGLFLLVIYSAASNWKLSQWCLKFMGVFFF